MATVAIVLVSAGTSQSATPLVFYASRSGTPTLDQDEHGGNPFASALISLLDRPSLSVRELRSDLIALTEQATRGFQVPDDRAAGDLSPWTVKPVPNLEKRVALVFVYSDYRDVGVSSLPGAERDLKRVAQGFRSAGFEVQSVANPKRRTLQTALEAISSRSRTADAAAVYLTGHGFEYDGRAYLMPTDYPFEEGPRRLGELAVNVAKIAGHLHAERANVVFFGGCRNYW